jgi:hypothetical protein
MAYTYLRVVLDLINGIFVESASVAMEPVLAVVGPLDTLGIGVALSNAALVNIFNPSQVALEVLVRLEGDDVAALDNVAIVALNGSTKGEPKEGGRSKSEGSKVDHFEETVEGQLDVECEVIVGCVDEYSLIW